MSDIRQVTELFARFCDLCIARNMAPLNEADGCVHVDIDSRWHISFNSHQTNHPSRDGFELEPFHGAVTFNGWPAGIFTPISGTIAAGESANENALIAAIDAAIAKEMGVET